MVGFLRNLIERKAKSAPQHPEAGSETTASPEDNENPALAAMKRAVGEKAKTDPMAPVMVTAEDILANLLETAKDSRGVNIETLLGIVGSLAGYSCHVAARDLLPRIAQIEFDPNDYVVATTGIGTEVYFGNMINRPLAEANTSVWHIVKANAEQLGVSQLPDLTEMFKHVVRTGGTVEFGVPRMPEGRPMADLPINFVTHLWPKYAPLLTRYAVQTAQWPVIWAVTAARTLQLVKDVVPPSECVKILMEHAIPASKFPLLAADAKTFPLPDWWQAVYGPREPKRT